ncbi:MAG: hypothetical protein NTY09_14150 [bacterium]|nr:hypothetical protein [bacterium]
MIKYIIYFGAISFLIMTGCQFGNHEITQSEDKVNSVSENSAPSFTLEDAFGAHNPLMIGGWGGLKTHEEWFLRCVRQGPRMDLLDMGLKNYYSSHFEFPGSWQELDESGYFPVRALDPITGQPFCFTKEAENNEDFINLSLEITPGLWVFKGQAINTTGQYYPYAWDFSVQDEWMVNTAAQDFELYPTDYAMRGYNLAMSCYRILWDYEKRRAEMPATNAQLLDSLWYVATSWAENDPSIDYTQPGGFMFGIDQEKGISVAIWLDETGQEYIDTRRWDPWPDGWHEIPAVGPRDGIHGGPWVDPEAGFVPETILWTCNLQNK